VARPAYEVRYARAVRLLDLLAIGASAGLYRFWGSPAPWRGAHLDLGLATLIVGAAVLVAAGTWDAENLGQGTFEFNRLFLGFVWLGILIALVGMGLKWNWLRPYAFGVVPIAFAFATLGRLALRHRLARRRAAGSCMRNVLAVGSRDAVAELIERTRRSTKSGLEVTGVCLPGGTPGVGTQINDVPVLGDMSCVVELVHRFGYHVVAVAHAPGWSSEKLHQLSWDLEGSGTSVVVDPGLMDIGGSRLRVDTLDGAPVLRLVEPKFAGLPKLIKFATDIVGALVLLALTAPLMIGIMMTIKVQGGPVFYRHQRIGKGGTPFTMLKFRTMVLGAEQMRAAIVEHDHGAGPLFKVVNDPRVTRLGRFLRKHSLDELPQLFNVLSGSMSLVGPRPPLPTEVAGYDRKAQRRLLVKPGMTGLWQVSGRSDLCWEDTKRLDCRYVENWTPLLDVVILWKTLGAVIRGSGAY